MQKKRGILETLQGFDLITLGTIKAGVLVLLAVDLFGVFWFLKMRSLGIAIFIACCVILAVVLLLERRLEDMERKEKEKKIKELREEADKLEKELKENSPIEENPKEQSPGGFGLGLPNPDEYNKRVEQALGSGF